MTWDYDPSLTTPKDQVRFLIGDTDKKDPLVQNEEIEGTLTLTPDRFAASAEILDSLAARFSRFATTRVGDISVSANQRAQEFADRAKELRKKSRRGAGPFFGGTQVSVNRGFHEDTDTRQPQFQIGQDDNPRSPDDAEHPHLHFHHHHGGE